MEDNFQGKKRNLPNEDQYNSRDKGKDYRKNKGKEERNTFIDFKTELKSEKFEFYYKVRSAANEEPTEAVLQ